MNKLPKVFQNPINKELKNYQKTYRSELKEIVYSQEPVINKINRIFSSPNHVYKYHVNIKTKNNTYNKVIIGINKDCLLTMDNELIRIIDIIDINEV